MGFNSGFKGLICQLSFHLIIARELGLCSKHTKNFPLHGFIGSANKTAQYSFCQRIGSNLRGIVEGIHEGLLWLDSSQSARASTLSRLRDHTQTHYLRQDSSGRVISPLQILVPDHKAHRRQTSMPPAEFEPAMPASEPTPQTERSSGSQGIEGIICVITGR